MEQINWIHIIVALIGGGAAGAIINALVLSFRSRPQPIGKRLTILPVFVRNIENSPGLEAKIAILHNADTITYDNLYLAEIQLANKGNKDLEEFNFGITLGENDKCIFVVSSSTDRHHIISQETDVSPQFPKEEIDFKLQPFNRRDSYFFKLYLVIPESAKEPKNIELSSSSPIKFTEMPTVGEVLTRIAEDTVNFGPISLSVSFPKIKYPFK